MKIALIGHGKMGKEVEAVAKERGVAVAAVFDFPANEAAGALTPAALKGIDVCIDFSTPEAVMKNIDAVTACGVNLVVGTTGWYDRIEAVKTMVRTRKTGFLYAANFSLGVNIFSQLVMDAARLFDRHSEYDVAIGESHHRGKADSPSGTALALGALVLQQMRRKSELLTEPAHAAIKPHQLHVTSTRVGHVTGKHTVVFDSDMDSIELIHTARSRRGFAVGALVGAEWLRGRKGFYTMRDVILE